MGITTCILLKAMNSYEPRHDKAFFLHMGKQSGADQLRGNRAVGQRQPFVFASYIDRIIPLLPKSEASSNLLWPYSPVCVGTGRKPRRQVLSRRRSYVPSVTSTAQNTIVTVVLYRAGLLCKCCNGFPRLFRRCKGAFARAFFFGKDQLSHKLLQTICVHT